MKNRSRIEIVAQILKIVADDGRAGRSGGDDGIAKTQIMYKAFLSNTQLKEYLSLLTENKMPDYEKLTGTFYITAKGHRFLKIYEQMGQIANV
jgi:predicted transcriptional regulator